MLNSYAESRGSVVFPAFTGERVYMREFYKARGLPPDLQRWQKTVDAMLDGVDTDGPIYVMIDQGMVKAGKSHRRPGLHVDGYWIPGIQAHGGGWRHSGISCAKWDTAPRWNNCNFSAKEALILASDVTASRAMIGEFSGMPGEGGDCSHIDTSGMEELVLQSGIVYAGNVTMLHESLPVRSDCLRTLVRLSVPGWEPDR